MQTIEETVPSENNVSRRSLLKVFGVGAAVTAASAFLAGCGGGSNNSSSSPSGPSDADILNFALNLEYLEAEFYTYAVTGKGLAASGIGTTGVGTAGTVTGGVQTTFNNATVQSIATELMADEQAHVTLLRGALGSYAVAEPSINLSALGSFTTLPVFLTLARAFEDTGVSAYGGAAPLISSKAYLQVAAQILGTEALHAGNLRLLIAENNISVSPTDSLDVVPPPAGTHYFTTTAPANGALAVIRTTAEVLNIVYAGKAGGGGFFPNGMNGTIH